MTRTTPRGKAGLFVEGTYEDRPSNIGFSIDFEDLCSYAMDRALGVERISLDTAVDLNANVLDLYRNSLRLAPGFSDFLDAAAKAFALCMNLQMSWLALMWPQAKPGATALSQFAVPAGTVASHSGKSAKQAAEEAERSLDVVIGRGNAA